MQLSDQRKKFLEATFLYEDEHFLVVNKPRGYSVHAGSDVAQGLIEQYCALRQDLPFLQLCHRLDRETTGCLLMAKTRPALLAYQELLKTQVIEKEYSLLVHGAWPNNVREITLSLEKQAQTTGPARIIASASGKVAQTLVEKVDIKGSVSYLEVRLSLIHI